MGGWSFSYSRTNSARTSLSPQHEHKIYTYFEQEMRYLRGLTLSTLINVVGPISVYVSRKSPLFFFTH